MLISTVLSRDKNFLKFLWNGYRIKVTVGDITFYGLARTRKQANLMKEILTGAIYKIQILRLTRLKNIVVGRVPLENRHNIMKTFHRIRLNGRCCYINNEKSFAHFVMEYV